MGEPSDPDVLQSEFEGWLPPASTLRDRSFLSVGAPGSYGEACFWAEEQAASSVTCVAPFNPSGSGFGLFQLLHCLRRSSVVAHRLSVYDISQTLLGGAF